MSRAKQALDLIEYMGKLTEEDQKEVNRLKQHIALGKSVSTAQVDRMQTIYRRSTGGSIFAVKQKIG